MVKLLLFLLAALLLVALGYVALRSSDDGPDYRTVRVERGRVVRHAVATGHVEPRFEVPVKSRWGGVLTRRFVELGQKVAQGQPLVEVRPLVTELDMLQAERALLSAREAEEDAAELRAGESLMGRALLTFQGRDTVERMKRGVERARSDAEERLELLREGQIEIEGKVIDFIVRAPIEGHVIELGAEVGEPVVPSSSYGSGTEILVLADLDHPLFRGTANEIDVGRLRVGMRAALEVGALPEAAVAGELIEVSLRSQSLNNATVFAVKLAVEPPEGIVLRSGYSAVARIEIDRSEDVLVLPERVVDYRGERAFVLVDGAGEDPVEREVGVGLSDGITVEVTEGLDEGDEVLERVW